MAHTSNFLVDTLLSLNGSTAITADGVGSGGIINLGGDGVVRGDIVIDVGTTTTNGVSGEVYMVTAEFSSDSAFASGKVAGTTITFGKEGIANTPLANSSAALTVGRHILPFINVVNGTAYRYMRLYFQVLGTSPSIVAPAYATITRGAQ